jgi:hypothetical protein
VLQETIDGCNLIAINYRWGNPMALSATERSQAFRAKRKDGSQHCLSVWITKQAYANLSELAQRNNTSITETLNRILEQLCE